MSAGDTIVKCNGKTWDFIYPVCNCVYPLHHYLITPLLYSQTSLQNGLFLQNTHKTPHSLPVRVRHGVWFVGSSLISPWTKMAAISQMVFWDAFSLVLGIGLKNKIDSRFTDSINQSDQIG